MLKTLTVTAATALTLLASTDLSQAHTFKSGFVAGGAIGYTKLSGKFNNSSTNTADLVIATNITSASTSRTKTSSAFAGSLFSGYRYVTESGFMVGVNLGFGLDGASLKHSGTVNTVTFNSKLKRKFHITPSLFLGKIIGTNWMVFTDLGLSLSRFNLKSTITDRTVTEAKKTSFTKVGFAPTLGVECAVNDRLSVIGTATGEFFGSPKKDVGSTVFQTNNPFAPIDTTENTVKVKPRYFTLKIGALYKF